VTSCDFIGVTNVSEDRISSIFRVKYSMESARYTAVLSLAVELHLEDGGDTFLPESW
jgi:hypothetical protein